MAARVLHCEPKFYPVGPDMAPASDPGDWPGARAVVAVNYFGLPQDLAPFRRYAERTGALLIEDNAHGLFSRDAEGEPLGLRGDAGIFSPRKTIAVPNGGILAVPPDGPVAAPAPGAFQAGLGSGYRLKQLLRRSVARLGRRPARALLKSLRLVRGEPGASAPPGALMPASLIAGLIDAADPEAEVERRRALYQWAEARLASLGGVGVFSTLPEGVSPYVFPFRADAAAAARIMAALDADGLDVFNWPSLPDEVEPSAPAHYRDVFCVRFLW